MTDQEERTPEAGVWEHRCPDGVGGCTAISSTYLGAVLELLAKVSRKLPSTSGVFEDRREEAERLLGVALADGYGTEEKP